MEAYGAIYADSGIHWFRRILKTNGWDRISDKQKEKIVKDFSRLKRRE